MTRKHFEAIAAALLSARPFDHEPAPGDPERTSWCVWADTVAAVASACAQSNALFDRDRFFAAAGR